MKPRHGMFLLVCTVQLLVAGGIVVRSERTLGGTAYRFQTGPVDPVDVMRGRYVRLAFPAEPVPIAEGARVEAGKPAYATLRVDDEGYAHFATAYDAPPAGADSLRVDVVRARGGHATLQLGFDRYYLDEHRAPEVDALMRSPGSRAVAVVRVRDGRGVIAALEVEGLASERAPLAQRLTAPPGVAIPDALVEAVARGGVVDPDGCGGSTPCVVFPVDLTDETDDEYVVQDPQSQLHYYRTGIAGTPGYQWAAHLRPREYGRMPTGAEILALFATPDAVASRPPDYRDLRLGDRLLAAQQ